jgi:hypothetical protein
MSNQWLRLWHDMPNDPKWRTIARVSKQSVSTVIAVYLHVLVTASNASERGRTQSLNSEDIASALDVETSEIEAILSAMQGRVLDGDKVAGWEKRQPLREDGAAERAKAWRESKKNAPVESANATERNQNAEERPDTDTDTEKAKTLSADADAIVPPADSGKGEKRLIPAKEIVAAYHRNLPMMPAVKLLTDERKRKLKARWTELDERQSLDYWDRFFAYVAASDWLTGRDGKWTSCDFEWLIEKSNHLKVTEGKYENRVQA